MIVGIKWCSMKSSTGMKLGTGIITFLFTLLILSSAARASHTNNTDYDSDTILNEHDNCPFVPNSGVAGELVEKQSGTFTVNGGSAGGISNGSVSYAVTLDFVDVDEAKFTVNNEPTPKLRENEAYFLSDHSKIIVQEIFYQDYANGIRGASFLIGAQKDANRNGVGDACPNYGNEEEQVLELQEQFEDLEEDYFTLKNAYKKNPVEHKVKLEALAVQFTKLQDDVQELRDDIDENNNLDNQNQLSDVLDELEEDVVRVKSRIVDLLSQNNSQEQPLPTYSDSAYSESQSVESQTVASPLLTGLSAAPPDPGGSKVTVLKFSLPLSTAEGEAGPELTSDNDAGIFWLITAIAIVLIMLLFLILAGMGEKW